MKDRLYYGWVVVAASFFGLFMVGGARSAFTVFLQPLIDEFGWTRASISLTASILSLVSGFTQPMIGRWADKRGPRLVISLGLMATGIGVLGLGRLSSLWELYFYWGVLVALGFAASAIIVNTALISRWFEKSRGLAISISSTGLPTGQLIFSPLLMALVLSIGWRNTSFFLGGAVLLLAFPIVVLLVRNHPAQMGLSPYGGTTSQAKPGNPGTSPGTNVTRRQAMGTQPFWFLAFGFFVCGFTIFLIFTHFVVFALDIGISGMAAANAFGLLGGVSIVGGLLGGAISDRLGRKIPLSTAYFLRGVGFLILTQTTSEAMLYLAAVILGLSALTTVTLTSAMVADTYGSFSVGTVVGIMFLGHQIGGALGAYLGGAFFDWTGSYFWPFLIAGVLGLMAALACTQIREGEQFQKSLADSEE